MENSSEQRTRDRAERKAHGRTSRRSIPWRGISADTNYLYATYHARHSDITPSRRKKILILGSGTYRIGSSVEFDGVLSTRPRRPLRSATRRLC
jgi:hypothetical protein